MSLCAPESLNATHRLGSFDCGKPLAIAEHAGIRAMLTHPIDQDAGRFYKRFGFMASPLREDQLLLLLKDARRFLK